MSQEPGFRIDVKNLGFVIAFVTVLGFIITGISKINGWDYRIDKLEQDNKVISAEVSKVADKLNNLNDRLVSLTITLSKVEERLNARLEKNNR